MAKSELITSHEAGKMLGMTGDTFDTLAEEYPWLQPHYLGTGSNKRMKRWERAGVEALFYILTHPPPEARQEGNRPRS